MKAMKQHTAGAGSAPVPFLTIIRLDYADPGAVHYVATDGGSLYEVTVLIPEGAEIEIRQNSAGYMELHGVTAIISGYETDALNGVHITGRTLRAIYSHEYVSRTFSEAETDLLMNAGNIAG